MGWDDRACGDLIYADLWTPPGDSDNRNAWKEARALCLECPLLDECRAWVFSQDEDPCPHSMVAALTPGQRQAKRRDGFRTKCGTTAGRKEHVLLGEEPCAACKEARNAVDREQRRAS